MAQERKLLNPKTYGRHVIGRTHAMTYVLRDTKGEYPDVETKNRDDLLRIMQTRRVPYTKARLEAVAALQKRGVRLTEALRQTEGL